MKWYIWIIVGFAATAFIAVIFFRTSDSGSGKPMPETIPDDDDVEALGRMIASENPRDGLAIQQAIAWTAVNMAAREGKSVSKLLMPNGIPGPQTGRYASTANPSTAKTRAVAADVLSGAVSDPTGGAIQFDAPDTQDWLYEHGKVKSNAAMIAASRMKDGKEVSLTLPGVTSSMRFWRYV